MYEGLIFPSVIKMLSCIVILLMVSQVLCAPIYLDPDALGPLAVVSELNSRLAHKRPGQERLPLPTPQDLEAIKKVAQILVMLGQQVIPSIIGEPQASEPSVVVDAPNDPVNDRAAV